MGEVTYNGAIRIESPRCRIATESPAYTLQSDRDAWLNTVDLSGIAEVANALITGDTNLLIRCYAGQPARQDGYTLFAPDRATALALDRTRRNTRPLPFLVAGQSNSTGHGLLSQVPGGFPVVPNNCINFGNDYRWHCPAAEPIDDNTGQVDGVSLDASSHDSVSDVPGVGHALAFVDRITDPAHGNRSNQCILIPCPLGGTSISQWQPGGSSHVDRATLYGSMLYRAVQASIAANAPIAGLIWYQGESDAFSQTPQGTFQTNTQALFTALRSDLTSLTGFDHSTMPVLIVEIGPTVFTGYDPTAWAAIQTAQVALANGTTQFTLQGPDGPYCDSAGNNWHLATSAQLSLGRSLADLYLAHF